MEFEQPSNQPPPFNQSMMTFNEGNNGSMFLENEFQMNMQSDIQPGRGFGDLDEDEEEDPNHRLFSWGIIQAEWFSILIFNKLSNK